MWTDLKQNEKYELIKDYVRRGFDNLDDIMNDYDSSIAEDELLKLSPSSLQSRTESTPIQDVLNEMYNEYYADPRDEWPGATEQDFDSW